MLILARRDRRQQRRLRARQRGAAQPAAVPGSVAAGHGQPDARGLAPTSRSRFPTTAICATATGRSTRWPPTFQWSANLTGGEAERVQGMKASASLFTMLGAKAALGRTLLPDDETGSGAKVVVLTHRLLDAAVRRQSGRRWAARSVLNGDAYTIVGVLPAAFITPVRDAEVIAPFPMDADPRRASRDAGFLRVTGRLRPGVTIDQAREDLDAIMARLRVGVPRDQRDAPGYGDRRMAQRARRHAAVAAAAPAGRGRARPAGRLRERRQPVPRRGDPARARVRRPRRARRVARAADAAGVPRDRADRGGRGRRRSWRSRCSRSGRWPCSRRRTCSRCRRPVASNPRVLLFTLAATLARDAAVRADAGAPARRIAHAAQQPRRVSGHAPAPRRPGRHRGRARVDADHDRGRARRRASRSCRRWIRGSARTIC